MWYSSFQSDIRHNAFNTHSHCSNFWTVGEIRKVGNSRRERERGRVNEREIYI